MWTKEKALGLIREIGIVAIIRTSSPEDAIRAAEAIIEGGISVAEITMTVPRALYVMEQLADHYGDKVLLGAGTILDAESCRSAMLAGAEFIVTPALDIRVIEISRRYSKPCLPGALSPTEVIGAWQAGADMVKVFPCGLVGGAKYIKALKGPFPQVDMVPTGGVSPETTVELIRAGASAVAAGSELVDTQALKDGKLEVITEKARRFVEAVRTSRATAMGS
jgi:2-dehydro-3-deoxyphosphogluconate aldolase/(4S)-4-hydroxy-2-oxoglutarate aldolase